MTLPLAAWLTRGPEAVALRVVGGNVEVLTYRSGATLGTPKSYSPATPESYARAILRGKIDEGYTLRWRAGDGEPTHPKIKRPSKRTVPTWLGDAWDEPAPVPGVVTSGSGTGAVAITAASFDTFKKAGKTPAEGASDDKDKDLPAPAYGWQPRR